MHQLYIISHKHRFPKVHKTTIHILTNLELLQNQRIQIQLLIILQLIKQLILPLRFSFIILLGLHFQALLKLLRIEQPLIGVRLLIQKLFFNDLVEVVEVFPQFLFVLVAFLVVVDEETVVKLEDVIGELVG